MDVNTITRCFYSTFQSCFIQEDMFWVHNVCFTIKYAITGRLFTVKYIQEHHMIVIAQSEERLCILGRLSLSSKLTAYTQKFLLI